MSDDLKTVLVNVADWTLPPGIVVPDGWVIANAPRPLNGEIAWQGPFRHGIFYVASPEVNDNGWHSWRANDGWLVTFITNDQIAERVAAKLAEYGYETADEVDSTVGELAIGTLQLPWHETTE
jgi:hypothetical protein